MKFLRYFDGEPFRLTCRPFGGFRRSRFLACEKGLIDDAFGTPS